MSRKEITEEEKTKYRKGCLTSMVIAFALIVLSSGISSITSYRVNLPKSAKYTYLYKCDFPKDASKNDILVCVSNNNFINVKTNLSDTGEGVSKGIIIKDQVLTILKSNDLQGSGIKVLSKKGTTIYDSTTKGGD